MKKYENELEFDEALMESDGRKKNIAIGIVVAVVILLMLGIINRNPRNEATIADTAGKWDTHVSVMNLCHVFCVPKFYYN